MSVVDIETHYHRALAAGARIARGPQEQSWGKSYEALDLEGHRWRFLQRVP